MATKSFTSLEQSKKLAEILPLESADMLFQLGEDKYADSIRVPLTKKHWEQMMPDINPCWSLAALLDIIRKAIGYTLEAIYDKNPKVFIVCELGNKLYSIESTEYDNEVDACYEMIIRLHELKML